MPDYIDPGPDPNYPNRPDHPHYRLLAQLLQDLDGDSGVRDPGPAQFCAAEKIDQASFDYAAEQRALRLDAFRSLMAGLPPHADLQVAWIDGFALGYLFALNRTDY